MAAGSLTNHDPNSESTAKDEVFAGGGEMGAIMHALDWSQTALGPVESWSIALRMMAKFLVANRFPLLLWWGPDFCQFVPLSKSGAELLFEVFSQRYERGSTMVTSNLPFQEWTEVLGSERLTGALLDRLTHHVHILEMNGESYRLKQSKRKRTTQSKP